MLYKVFGLIICIEKVVLNILFAKSALFLSVLSSLSILSLITLHLRTVYQWSVMTNNQFDEKYSK